MHVQPNTSESTRKIAVVAAAVPKTIEMHVLLTTHKSPLFVLTFSSLSILHPTSGRHFLKTVLDTVPR